MANSSPAACPQGVPSPDARLTYRESRVLPAGVLNFLPPRRLFQNGPRAPGLSGRRPARRCHHAPLLPGLPAGDVGSYKRDGRLWAGDHELPHTKGFYTEITLQCSAFSRKTGTHWARLQQEPVARTASRGVCEQTRGPPRGSQRLHGGLDTEEGTERLLEKNTTHDEVNFTLL